MSRNSRQENRSKESHLCMSWKESQKGRGDGHQNDGGRQGVFSSYLVPEMTEECPAQRSHEEARSEHAECGKQRSKTIIGGEEQLSQDGSKKAKERKIVPLQDVAQ